MNKKTIIIGASDNPDRYAYKAAISLQKHNHEIVLLGKRSGAINGIKIINDKPEIKNVDTVTLYINSKNQQEWYDYIINTKPKRVVFNPGTENIEFEELLKQNKIEVTEACTLVLLSIGDY